MIFVRLNNFNDVPSVYSMLQLIKIWILFYMIYICGQWSIQSSNSVAFCSSKIPKMIIQHYSLVTLMVSWPAFHSGPVLSNPPTPLLSEPLTHTPQLPRNTCSWVCHAKSCKTFMWCYFLKFSFTFYRVANNTLCI